LPVLAATLVLRSNAVARLRLGSAIFLLEEFGGLNPVSAARFAAAAEAAPAAAVGLAAQAGSAGTAVAAARPAGICFCDDAGGADVLATVPGG